MSPPVRRFRPEEGINLVGYFLAESGVGEHARTMLATLDEAGVPVAPLRFGETRSRQLAELPELEWLEPAFPVNLVCVNADQTPHFFERHPELRAGRHTIGYWHWEVEEFPDAMAASARFVDEIWTASEHSRAAIARKVDRPVFALPPAVLPPPREDLPADLLPPGEGPLVLTCFDFDSVVERKNPAGSIEAFRRAFPAAGSGPRLLIKSVNGELHPDALAALRARCADRPDIRIVDRYLRRGEQARLIASCDVFLSLHRAEGFGLMLAEAMAAARPVIATDYSGSREFLDATCGFPIPWQETPIPDGAGPYRGTWAEPDLDAAAERLRSLVADPDGSARIARAAQRRVLERWTPAGRAPAVRERLSRIELRDAPAAAPDRAAREIREKLERLARGIDSGPASDSGGFLRRALRRATRPLWTRQRDVDRALLEILGATRNLQERDEAAGRAERLRLLAAIAGLRRRLARRAAPALDRDVGSGRTPGR